MGRVRGNCGIGTTFERHCSALVVLRLSSTVHMLDRSFRCRMLLLKEEDLRFVKKWKPGEAKHLVYKLLPVEFLQGAHIVGQSLPCKSLCRSRHQQGQAKLHFITTHISDLRRRALFYQEVSG